jgi:hypothetical protein
MHIGESGQPARGSGELWEGDVDGLVAVTDEVGRPALPDPLEQPATLTRREAAPAATTMVSRLPEVPTTTHNGRLNTGLETIDDIVRYGANGHAEMVHAESSPIS